MKKSLAFVVSVSMMPLFAALSPSGGTKIYRTTEVQDFREVANADWSKLSTGPGAQIVDLDSAKESHTYRGLGGSFAEASCYVLKTAAPETRAKALEMLYGKSGLRLSTGRIHCGSSDYSMSIYSYDDVEGDKELKHFSIDNDRKWVLPVIKEALKVNPDIYFFSSPWSAPWWMKDNKAVSAGHLLPDMYDAYAEYIARFIGAYAREGIDINAHSPQNEPCINNIEGWARNSPTMEFFPEEEAKLVLALRKSFDAAKLKTKLWLFDFNYSATNYLAKLLAVPGVKEAGDGIAWHSYGGDPEVVKVFRKMCPEYENIHTEQGPSVNRAERNFLFWGDKVLRGFNAGLTGYTNWLLVTDENGQPNTSCGHPCCGLVTIHSETGEIETSGQYKFFLHVSPFVVPGAKVLDAPVQNNLPGCIGAKRLEKSIVSSFKNPDGSYVVVISHAGETGAQVVIKHDGRYLPVILLPKSITTVTIK